MAWQGRLGWPCRVGELYAHWQPQSALPLRDVRSLCWRQRFSWDLVLLRVHPASVSQGRPHSTQFWSLGHATWASLRKLASATPTDWPKRLGAVGRPDSHPLEGSARQPALVMLGWRTLGPWAAPVCPSTAGCRLSVLSRRVQTQPGRTRQIGELYAPSPAPVCSWREHLTGDRFRQEQAQPRRSPATGRPLRPLPARSALLLWAGPMRTLPTAWQRGLGQLPQRGQRQAHWRPQSTRLCGPTQTRTPSRLETVLAGAGRRLGLVSLAGTQCVAVPPRILVGGALLQPGPPSWHPST